MRRSLRWSDVDRVVVGAAVAATAWVVGVQVATGDVAAAGWLADLTTGVAIMVMGVVVASVGPHRWPGLIVLAGGASWFLGNLAGASPGWVAWTGERTQFVHRALLLIAPFAVRRSGVLRWVAPIVVATTLIGPLMQRPVSMIVWSVAAVILGIRVLGTRRPMPDWSPVVVLGTTVAGTAAGFLAWGSAPATRTVISFYELGVVGTAATTGAVVLLDRIRADRLADAVVEVALGPAGTVRTMLADALRDPGVDIAFAAGSGWVDELGRSRGPLVATAGRAIVDIALAGDASVVARLSCVADITGRPHLVGAIETATTLAARNASLRAALRDEAAELDRSRRRLVVAADEQRIQLSRTLEVSTSQSMARLDELLAALAELDHDGAEIVGRGRERLSMLRGDLAALTSGLGPPSLERGDLAAAVAELLGSVELTSELVLDPTSLPHDVAVATYFVCAEAVTNIVKHAAATHVSIRSIVRDGSLRLEVTDDGAGGAAVGAGSGLRGLGDRVAAFGGTVDVRSTDGRGTTVTASIPLR